MVLVLAPWLAALTVFGNPCFSTLDQTFALEIPALDVDGASYAIDLAYSAAGPVAGAAIWFRVTGIHGSTLTECSNPARLLSWPDRLVVRLPVVQSGEAAWWADLEYVPTTDGQIWLTVAAGGELPHRVFVTSVQGQGDLGAWPDSSGVLGIAAGDAICEARARAAGLPGAYVAWLSDDTLDAYCRVHGLTGKMADHCGLPALPVGAGPWVRTDGFPFAARIDQLVNLGKVYAPARSDEFGDPAPMVWYFTNTNPSGDLSSYYSSPCQNWTASSTAGVGAGITDWTTGGWTTAASMSCDSLGSLLCFEIGPGPALPVMSTPGKRAFVTSVSGGGNLGGWPLAGGKSGLAAGDAICQACAAAAGVANAGKFKAWLSSGATDARDRLSSNGPWVRLDGVEVARDKADLVDGWLESTINVTETGLYRGIFEYVWTGTSHSGTAGEHTCAGWTSGSSADSGNIGRAWDVGGWTYAGYPSCDRQYPIYCLED
jgi:hypothetical protein